MPETLPLKRRRLSLAQTPEPPLLTVVIPFYNEASVLPVCHQRLCEVLDSLKTPNEILYVDDGSSDDSWEIAKDFHSHKQHIGLIRLSRNFGKEAAMSAGLQHANGRGVIVLDADLQDPPELIPAMIEQWRKGHDVVEMKRRYRHGERFFKRWTAKLFYRFINRLSDIPIPENVGDFRLLDRRVVDEINRLPERSRYMKGLFSWPGFKRVTVEYDRDPRHSGESKWSVPALLNLAVEGITSFSTRPLRLATAAGAVTGLLAIALATVILVKTLVWGDPVAGYPSMVLITLILGSVQLLSIGLMGEYIGRLFIETKQRPLYVVMDQQHYAPSCAINEVSL